MKLTLGIVTILAAAVTARGADLQAGYSFADGQHLTASQLHALVNNGTILTGFYTGKTPKYTLDGADKLLVYSASLGAYRVISATSALYTNSALITGQTAKSVPGSGDYVLLFDAAAGDLKKATLGTMVSTTNVVALQPEVTSADPDGYLLVLNYGTNARITLSNLWLGFKYSAPLTNLSEHYAPTNLDRLLIWDSVAGTNKTITLSNLVDNLPANASPDPARDVVMTVTASNLAKVTLNTLANVVSNRVVLSHFESADYAVNSGSLAVTNHGLGRTPALVRWVLKCRTNDSTFVVGDELPVETFQGPDASTYGDPVFQSGANSSNVFLYKLDVIVVGLKNNGTIQQLSTNNWRAKCYAWP